MERVELVRDDVRGVAGGRKPQLAIEEGDSNGVTAAVWRPRLLNVLERQTSAASSI
jgi:hypothetical protein